MAFIKVKRKITAKKSERTKMTAKDDEDAPQDQSYRGQASQEMSNATADVDDMTMNKAINIDSLKSIGHKDKPVEKEEVSILQEDVAIIMEEFSMTKSAAEKALKKEGGSLKLAIKQLILA